MSRIDDINGIIDDHIQHLKHKHDVILNDAKMVTETLKSILLLEQIKAIEGKKTDFDNMSVDDLKKQLEDMEDE